jgi:hypothetical protein
LHVHGVAEVLDTFQSDFDRLKAILHFSPYCGEFSTDGFQEAILTCADALLRNSDGGGRGSIGSLLA